MNLKVEQSESDEQKIIRHRLEEDDNYFQELVDLIPPKFYFDKEIIETLNKEKEKTTNEKLRGLKMNRKKSAKGKNALARLDPYQHKTVSQIQKELDIEEKESFETSKLSATEPTTSSLQELQERLRTKIASLTAKRKGALLNETNSEVKQWKRKRSKIKNDKASKKIKLNKNVPQISFPSNITEKKIENNKPVYNKDKKLLYSKFDFQETENNFSKQPSKNYKKILEKTLKEKEEMKTMQVSNPEKAFIKNEKANWRKAIEKAEGVKLKDDPELLKKSIKKQEQKKRHSQKKWKERKDLVEKFKRKKQRKRSENIKAKKVEKIGKKIKRAKKKGRIL